MRYPVPPVDEMGVELQYFATGRLTPAGIAWVTAREEERWLKGICPPRFREARIDTLTAEAREAVQRWSEGSGNLLIIGPVGTGKTHTALAAARERYLAGQQGIRFAPVVELLDNLRPDARPVDEYTPATQWMKVYAEAELLILDDIGGEKPSDWTAERLYLLVNDRWLNMRPTIATTNLAPADLKEAIGERTYDRLRDGAVAVQLGGESKRRQR